MQFIYKPEKNCEKLLCYNMLLTLFCIQYESYENDNEE